MRRTEQVQGLRLMKFEEVYGRTHRGGLSQAEAAEVLGVSERTFRRWRDCYMEQNPALQMDAKHRLHIASRVVRFHAPRKERH